MRIFSREFTLAAVERAVKTAAQAAVLAILGTGAMEAAQTDAFSVNWLAVLGFALGGFVLSYLTSLSSSNFGEYFGPSLVDEAVMVEEIVVQVEDDE